MIAAPSKMPTKRKASAPAKVTEAIQNTSRSADSRLAEPGLQESKTLKYRLLWLAVMPAPRKLVALALANHSNPDGTSIFCSQGTVSAMCGIKPQQVSRHLADLVSTGVLKLVRKATQHTPANYSLDLLVLADLALKEGLDESSTAFKDGSGAPGVHRKRLQTRLLRNPDPPLKHDYPLHPSGEEEGSAGGPASPAPEIPEGVDALVWTGFLAARPDLDPGEKYAEAKLALSLGSSAKDVEGQIGFLIKERKLKQIRPYGNGKPLPAPVQARVVDYAEGF